MKRKQIKNRLIKIISNSTIVSGLLFTIVGWYFFCSCSNSNTTANKAEVKIDKPYEPPFVKEGELIFWSAEGTNQIKKIDIEVAKTEAETTRGMMFRRNVADSTGMLFIMPLEGPQSFFMKNTLISLDIIYVNSKQKIVDIYKNAVPKSEKSLPSKAPAKFVVEVVGGFCDQYGVKIGDYVTFEGPGL